MLGFILRLIPGFSTIVALAQFLLGVAYPTYESFKAIETTGTKDDTQWLSYWVVFSMINLGEKFLWPILRWVPLYGVVKAAALAWLTLPQFRGAKFVYSTYVRPILFALVEKAKEIPAVEPYVRDFSTTGAPQAASQLLKKAEHAVANAQQTAGAVVEDDMANLKAHAQ